MGVRDGTLALLLAGLLFAAYLPGLFWGLPTGKSINGALQILEGRIPYRDFWTMYAPGSFYLTAGVFLAFGKEVIFQGAVSLGIQAAIAAVAFLLLRQLGASRRVAVLMAGVLGAAMWTAQPEIVSYHPALLLLLVALHQLVGYFRDGGPGKLFWAGLWIGLAACFKHDVAAYVGCAVVLGLFFSWGAASARRPPEWITPWRATARLASGIMAFGAPVAAWVALQAGADAWQDLFVFPATDYPKVRGEPYPSLLPLSILASLGEWIQAPSDLRLGRAAFSGLETWLLGNLPQYVFLLALALLITRRERLSAADLATAITLTAAVPFFWLAAHVQQNTHLYSMAVISALLLVLGSKPAGRRGRTVVLVMAVAYGVGLFLGPMMQIAQIRLEWEGSQVLDIPGARWIRLPARSHDVYHPVVSFLRRTTHEDEQIYVGVERHDAIVVNDPRFYYLAGRLGCCRYSELHPGVTDRIAPQREIIEDLEKEGVRAVVIWRFGWPDSVMARVKKQRMAEAPGTGATLLNEYIAEHFAVIMSRGEYDVLWRQDVPVAEAGHRGTKVEPPAGP
jgi:hypothetical protein